MQAYDYDRQCWVEGPAAEALIRQQALALMRECGASIRRAIERLSDMIDGASGQECAA